MTRNHDDQGIPTPDGRQSRGDDAQDYVVRREEQLVAGTEQHVVGRVTVRKRIVEEQRQITVTLRREEVDIIEEGADSVASAVEPSAGRPSQFARGDARDATRRPAEGAPAAEANNELVLFAERPVITTEWVPVERVRLDRRTVEGVETVTAEVAREVVELDDDRHEQR